tara:strand:- start:212 stop:400 length:189 start_codon:yes stop_codon:yes gene_type:complete
MERKLSAYYPQYVKADSKRSSYEIQDGVSKVIMLKKIKKYRSLSAFSTLRELFKKGLIKRTV